MRVLHTSDWHLGLSTGPVSRADDHALFLDWLSSTIAEREVDALVVAGDVFDNVQPSAESLQLYYRFLAKLGDSGVGTVIIIGGNHDSQARLDAPRELLDAMDVHVVGGLPPQSEGLDRLVVPIRGHRARGHAPGSVIGVGLAVPYVHEYRLGIRTTDPDRNALAQIFRDRFASLYRELVDLARSRYPDVPLFATGHLTVGSEHRPEDYPQEIHQVGSIDALPSSIFDARLGYVALGHIHRCYPVDGDRAWYCGSPIPTSVTERSPSRRVLCVELGLDQTQVERIDVPAFRTLHLVEGTLGEVEAQLRALANAPHQDPASQLSPLVFVRLQTDAPVPDLRTRLSSALHSELPRPAPILVELREMRTSATDADDALPVPALEDLTPRQVFLRRCAAAGIANHDALDALTRAFDELSGWPEDDFEERIAAVEHPEGEAP